MGRKEFYERLEELNQIRRNLIQWNNLSQELDQSKLLNQIEGEISHLKLLQES